MPQGHSREEMAARRASTADVPQSAFTPVFTDAPHHNHNNDTRYTADPNVFLTTPRRSKWCGVWQTTASTVVSVVHKIVPPGGITSGAFNMAGASIGAGILGLPAATDSAGLVLAMIYLVIITYLSVFSMYILALAAQSTRIRSFEGMARWLFPSGNYAFSYWAAFIRWFHAFAGCVAYIISIGNCLDPIFKGALRNHPDNSAIKFFSETQGLRVLTVVIWFCVMVPMVVPKHIDSLRYASAVAVTFMVYFVIVVVVHSCRHGLPENRHHVKVVGDQDNDDKLEFNTVFLFRSGNSVIHSVGVFMFAYVCQINAHEIYWDFRPEIRTTKNYTWAAFIGMLLCGTLYVMVCVFGYFDFGSRNLLGKSLLLMFHPLEEADVMIAYVGVLIKLCVAYALLCLSARNALYYLIGFQHRYRNRPDAAAAAGLTSSGNSLDDMTTQRTSGSLSGAATTSSGKSNSNGTDEVEKPKPAKAAATTAVPEDDMIGDFDDTTAAAAATMHEHVDKSLKRGDATMRDDEELAAEDVDGEFGDNTAEDTTYVDNIPFWQHLLVVLLLAVASLLCGLFIPNINTVFGFAGSISGGFLAFVFPALFFMYSGNFSLAQVGWFTYLNTYVLLICGVVGIVFGTGGTIYETI